MSDQKTTEPKDATAVAEGKKPYSPPQLVRYGDLEAITAAALPAVKLIDPVSALG